MHPNGQLPAYEWALRRRQPAGARLGGVARLQDREEAARRRRPRVPRARLPQAAAQLHLVGEPQGRRRQQHLPGRISRPRQHRRLRPQRAAARPAATSSSRTARAGWRCTRSTCWPSRMELARDDPAYEDVASKFWEHFLYIAHAIDHQGNDRNLELWDDEDGFFYDVLHLPDGSRVPAEGALDGRPHPAVCRRDARARSCSSGCPASSGAWTGSSTIVRISTDNVACMRTPGRGERRLLSVVDGDRLRRVLRVHARRARVPVALRHPRALAASPRASLRARASTATSTASTTSRPSRRTGLFGGNSNWRGPIWFPVNYLLIESLQKFHHYFGDDFKVECPTGSGQMMTLWRGRRRSSRAGCRASSCATTTGAGRCFGDVDALPARSALARLVLFHEYFHGDTGHGVGASHQTGWTGLVAKLLQQSGE